MKLTITITNLQVQLLATDSADQPRTLHTTIDCTTMQVEVQDDEPAELIALLDAVERAAGNANKEREISRATAEAMQERRQGPPTT